MYSKSIPNPGRSLHHLAVVTGNFLNAEPFASLLLSRILSPFPRACDSDGTKKENEFYGALTFFLSAGELRDPRRRLIGVQGLVKFPYLFCCGCVSKVGKVGKQQRPGII